MSIIKFDDVKKHWYEIAKHTTLDDNFSFELEIHKKLLNFFHIGPYYYYIFNCTTAEVEFTSQSVKQVLGLSTAEDFSINHLLDIIHPEDLHYFYDFESKVTHFFTTLPPDKVLKYKVSYGYRARRQDGRYINILQQVVTIQSNENGAVIRVLGTHTDITHLNAGNGSTLSFIGLDGEPSYYDVNEDQVSHIPQKELFTKREKEVVELLLLNQTSKEIAETLFISKLTVDGHRKNLLKKANCNSTAELIMKVMQQQAP